MVRESGFRSFASDLTAQATVYSIGEPTAEEQLYVELINRARSNPVAESIIFRDTTDPRVTSAYDFFNVDSPLMVSQFAVIQPVPPVAINAKLTAAARKHSQDMFNNAFQGHVGSSGSSAGTRVQAEGYVFQSVSENVFSYAESVFHGHAGFEVDWGQGIGGMQTPPGHRNNIHSANMREVGVGMVLGSNTKDGITVGPQLVTQNFAFQPNAKPFITGVAYYDFNGNNFYDVGEGIGGVKVTVSGTGTTGISAKSGGYAVPVAGDGVYQVTFSGQGFNEFQTTASVVLNQNVKVDFKPLYAPSLVTGLAKPGTNINNVYAFSAVAGASEYQWRQFQKIAPQVEGAENDAGNVTIIPSNLGYPVIDTTIKKSGTASFHFAHPRPGQAVLTPAVTLNGDYLLRADSIVNFESRLGWASTAQRATVEVSTDGGATWTTVFTQAGTGASGESTFTAKAVSLGDFAGKSAKIRFFYQFNSGSFFDQTSNGVGWYVDDIQLANADQIANLQVQTATGGTFNFNPPSLSDYALQVRAKVGHEFLDWGPMLAVRAVSAPLQLRISRIGLAPRGLIQVDFDVVTGDLPAGFLLQSKTSINGQWGNESATAQLLSPGKYRFTTDKLADVEFFRVREN